MVKNLIKTNTASSSDVLQTQSQTQSQHRNLGIKQDPRSLAGFVVGIQEPHFKHKKIPGLRAHTLLIDSSHPEPRAAIFHSRNLNIWAVPQLTNRDMCTGLFVGPNKERIFITSLYLPSKGDDKKDVPLRNIITEDIKNLLTQVKKEKAELIIMADVNAWSELWRSDRTTGQSGK